MKALLIYFASQLVYYPVIMTIFANVRGEKLKLREIVTISLSFFVIDITSFPFLMNRMSIELTDVVLRSKVHLTKEQGEKFKELRKLMEIRMF